MKQIAIQTVINPDRRFDEIKDNIEKKINSMKSEIKIELNDNNVQAY